MEERTKIVQRQQKSPPKQQRMNGKQLNLATNQVMVQLSFRISYRSHSVTSEFNIQKDIWQPLSTFTEIHMPAENTKKPCYP